MTSNEGALLGLEHLLSVGMREFIVRSGEPDAERRACRDCLHLRGALSLWCTDEDAKEHWGTSTPGFQGCRYWKPMRRVENLPTRRPLLWWRKPVPRIDEYRMILVDLKD